jgi:hypothetical protein
MRTVARLVAWQRAFRAPTVFVGEMLGLNWRPRSLRYRYWAWGLRRTRCGKSIRYRYEPSGKATYPLKTFVTNVRFFELAVANPFLNVVVEAWAWATIPFNRV